MDTHFASTENMKAFSNRRSFMPKVFVVDCRPVLEDLSLLRRKPSVCLESDKLCSREYSLD
jgi:hypothetical protein